MFSISLAAEQIFQIGALPVTNSMINTWIVTGLLIIGALLIRTRIKDVPRGLQNFFEATLEFFFKYLDAVTHDRRKSEKFLPLVGTLFIFILLSNWLGLIPGTGTIGFWQTHNGEQVLVPLLRPATSDLNTTLALSIFAILATHVFGVVMSGFFKHVNKFINLKGIAQSLKSFKPTDIFVAFVRFFVGIIEIFSEVAKTVSLSLRLFGNIFAGEVLLVVIGSLIAFIAPLPFMFLELFVGFIQATIFAMLTLVFLQIATSEAH